MVIKIGGRSITAGRGGELTRENSSPRGCAEYTGCVRIGEVDSASGELVNVRSDRVRRRFQAAEPVIHIINR